jgi:uncharacterized protein YccT (UPF0319 family)
MLSFKNVSIVLLGSLCWGGTGWSDQLTLPEFFNVLMVNGQKQKTKWFQKERVIALTKGDQKILLQYEDFYDVGFDDHEKVTSRPFVLSFHHEKGDLKADFIRPEFLKMAQLFAKNPDLKLIEVKTGKRVSMHLEAMSKKETKKHEAKNVAPLKEPFPTSTPAKMKIKAPIAQPEKKPAMLAPVKIPENVNIRTPAQESSPETPAKTTKTPLDHLRVWWKRASIEERQSFMRDILN